jgi:DNA-directed RNA polymerase specialized sigma24 family protein
MHSPSLGAGAANSAAPNNGWVLGKTDWDSFLRQLHPDPEQAAEFYERLRARLISFFRGRRLNSAEDHADDAIDRMIKAAAREPIRDPMNYGLAVARYIACEARRKPREVSLDESRDFPDLYVSTEAMEARVSEQLDRIEECSALLEPEEKEVLFSWYRHEKREKIEEKRKLAAKLGITVGTLRVRAFRIRERVRCGLHGRPNMKRLREEPAQKAKHLGVRLGENRPRAQASAC